jgi:transcriptional regulator with XRE-family HTH domain
VSRARHLVQNVHMTHQPASGSIPNLTLGWRLRMSLDYANISVQQMATQLGVSRATLSRWMADKGERPKRAYLSQWSLATGVPYEWIDTGKPPPDGGGDAPRVPPGSRPTQGYFGVRRLLLQIAA